MEQGLNIKGVRVASTTFTLISRKRENETYDRLCVRRVRRSAPEKQISSRVLAYLRAADKWH